MKTNQIKAITIYGESSFIPKVLSQVCKDFLLETFPYSDFAATAINARPSIVLVDVRNQMVFDKAIKPYLQFYSLYPLILLIPNDILIPEGCHGSQLDVLAKPLTYRELSAAIESRLVDCIYQISQDVFLNCKSMSLIKTHLVKGSQLTKDGLQQSFSPSNDECSGDQPYTRHCERSAAIHLQLTPLEFRILKYILETSSSSKNATTEKEILTNVFGYHDASSTNTFKVHLHRLRQKLGFDLIERKNNGEYIIRTLEIGAV
jgi:DNA-binding response OmpR family regulator